MSITPSCLDVQNLTVSELLSAYGAILDELRRREIVRSSNNPLSDYAELLFCKAFGWSRGNNSAAGHDAIDGTGVRYQVKGRRLTRQNASRQMSAIDNLDKTPFDQLAGVLVGEGFRIIRAASCPSLSSTPNRFMWHTPTVGDSFCGMRFGISPMSAT
jgi:hypothetical protein